MNKFKLLEGFYLAFALCSLLLLPACDDSESSDCSDSDIDTDTDTDTDTDSDTGTDTDTDGDSDSDADSDTDTDTDTDTDADSDELALDIPMRWQISLMEDGLLTCVELTDGYLQRIAEIDEGPYGINAMLTMADDPMGAAAAIDDDVDAGLALHGAVIALKDNIDTADMVTTAGSLALSNNLPSEDAPIVAKIREAGGLVIGKTNLSEWANFRGNRSTSGWSSAGGQTLNGAVPEYNPCGSSSGSGAAVAAGLVSAALGTETSGSVVCPAAVNGVVGFKPTVGLVSRSGIVPLSHSQDTAGTLTKTVGDAARLLSVIAGPDPDDPATAEIPYDMSFDFEAGLEEATLDGLRLGVPNQHVGYNPALDEVFEAELARLEAAGVELVEVDIPAWGAYGNDLWTVLIFDFKADLNQYLADHAQEGQVATLAELIQFNIDNEETVMPYFGQEVFEEAETTTGLDDPEYLDALAAFEQTVWTDGIQVVMEEENLDGFVSPTTVPAWKTNYTTGDVVSGSAAPEPAAARLPHITVPMGDIGGRPVGISFFAGRWEDAKVLQMGYAYEQLQ